MVCRLALSPLSHTKQDGFLINWAQQVKDQAWPGSWSALTEQGLMGAGRQGEPNRLQLRRTPSKAHPWPCAQAPAGSVRAQQQSWPAEKCFAQVSCSPLCVGSRTAACVGTPKSPVGGRAHWRNRRGMISQELRGGRPGGLTERRRAHELTSG